MIFLCMTLSERLVAKGVCKAWYWLLNPLTFEHIYLNYNFVVRPYLWPRFQDYVRNVTVDLNYHSVLEAVTELCKAPFLDQVYLRYTGNNVKLLDSICLLSQAMSRPWRLRVRVHRDALPRPLKPPVLLATSKLTHLRLDLPMQPGGVDKLSGLMDGLEFQSIQVLHLDVQPPLEGVPIGGDFTNMFKELASRGPYPNLKIFQMHSTFWRTHVCDPLAQARLYLLMPKLTFLVNQLPPPPSYDTSSQAEIVLLSNIQDLVCFPSLFSAAQCPDVMELSLIIPSRDTVLPDAFQRAGSWESLTHLELVVNDSSSLDVIGQVKPVCFPCLSNITLRFISDYFVDVTVSFFSFSARLSTSFSEVSL